ncbi:MAG: zinc ribbon domain-containing protein [Clostridiales bacterium]|nr:zinc ribbon domain-containing protein [Clostridiales bacterium]
MFCTKCGTQLPDDSKYCYKCGAPTHLAEQKDQIGQTDYDPFDIPPQSYNPPPQQQPQPQVQPQAQPQQYDNNNTTDEGIYGLVGFIFSFFIPILGLIFSIIGMGKKKNNGLATAGFIISLITIIIVVVAIIAIATSSSHSYSSYFSALPLL